MKKKLLKPQMPKKVFRAYNEVEECVCQECNCQKCNCKKS